MTEEKKDNEVTVFNNSGFKDLITPKKIKDFSDLHVFRCPCGGSHMRHAGYVQVFLPFLKATGTKHVDTSSYWVMVCTQCKKCYTFIGDEVFDITEHIDLKSWKKAEDELKKDLGDGGGC